MVAIKSVGIAELKANPEKVLRMVRDSNTPVDVTVSGEVVATINPVHQKPNVEDIEAIWRRHDEIGREISSKWPKDFTAQDAINDIRRNL